MINLLLPIERNKRRAEYRQRLFVTAGLLSLAFLLIILVIAGSLYWFIRFRRAEVEQNLASIKHEFAGANLDQAAAEIKRTNDELKHLRVGGIASTPSLILDHLIAPRGAVTLRQIAYRSAADQPTLVSVTGKSPTRQEFLNYLSRLQGDPLFVKIESPVKNLIQEKNLAFNLELVAK